MTGTGKYEALLERCRGLEPVPTAVAHPCEETALAGAMEAAAKGLIVPILVGPSARIQEIAKKAGIDLGNTTIVEAPHEADLEGRHIVVSAGGTREAIDPVRFIGNRSTGRMGVAVAEAALARGARVTIVAADVEV